MPTPQPTPTPELHQPIYSPLKSPDEIRLLTVQPGPFEDELDCTLTVTNLDQSPTPSFESVSYCWGDPTVTSLLKLNGQTTQVPASAAAALRRLRLDSSPRVLWIDALCINQQDVEEKSRAVQSSDNRSGTKLHARSLRKANSEFDDWEQSWNPRLANISSIKNRMPFTSARWYRLSLNSACLGPLLSTASNHKSQHISASLLESLDISLTAATQTLVVLSTWGKGHVSQVNCQEFSSLPDGSFEADEAECDRLQFAVDSTWISHTFCITFLILCYIRGAIDDELRISRLSPTPVLARSSTPPPQADSLLARLLRLGNDILNYVCQISPSHPAHQFRAVVRGATALVLSNNAASTHETQEVDLPNIQAFSDLMREFDMDWPGNLFDLDDS